MSKRFQLVALAAAAGMLVAASSAMAQELPANKDMLKCETSTGGALSKFTGSKSKCASKCLTTARKTSGPYTDCFAPYGGATLTCITDSVKGAEAKAAAAIVKACSSKADACPACFPTGACTDNTGNNSFVHGTETTLDAFGPLTYCVEHGAGTPSKTDAKCEDGLVKNLVKFAGAKGKCYTKCLSNAFAGKVPAATCVAPATDPATVACVSKASGKAVAALDKACFVAPATFPSCYGAGFNTSQDWVNLTEGAVDTVSNEVGCGSPSGAFLAD